MKIAFSARYLVRGVYIDRSMNEIHVYPFYCIRITIKIGDRWKSRE